MSYMSHDMSALLENWQKNNLGKRTAWVMGSAVSLGMCSGERETVSQG